ncbi:hypothetical protein [Aureitalea marina]|uniref:Lipocalin-like domain-containing protein n=1 Tax=Aureitalea marina TaxID=930804 RepID=A0A2S7KR07_9FLAO|nr:hypothetical protein [Aureitalea marina]PQB05055.1 hypothetical protein BST85_09225 [Aureitalea marina]
MKKIFTLLLLAAVIGSCSSDDDAAPPAERTGDLTGNWQVASYLINGDTTIEVFDEVTVQEFSGIGADFNSYNLIFSESPNNYNASGTYIFTLTTTQDGETFVQGSQVNISQNGTWTRNNNRVTIEESTETYDIVINLLTDTRLEFTRQISEQTVNPNNSTTITTTAVEEFICFRFN